MLLLGHQSVDDVASSAALLKAMGHQALRLLGEVVEHQGVDRLATSKSALDLENAGFVFIRDRGYAHGAAVRITPSHLGEEALAYLDGEILVDRQPSTAE